MAEPWYSALPVVVLDGRELAENWAQELEEAWVETSVAQPSQAFLRFRDPDRAALDKHNLNVAIGTPLVVKVSVDGVLEPLFAGEVTALQTQYSAEDGTFTVVRGMDGGHRLLRGRQVIAYADTTIKKIVEKIAMRAKLQCGDVEADGTSLPYVAQPNMTDWEMLQHLAHEHGLRVSMEGSRGTVLCLRRKAPGAGKPRVWREQNLLSVDAVLTSTDQVDTVEVRGWEVKTRTVLKGKADIEKSDRVRVGMKPSETTRPFGKARLLVSGRPYASMHEVESAARALAADCAAGFAQLQAEAEGDPALRAGQWVTLADIGAPFAGTTPSRRAATSSAGIRRVRAQHSARRSWSATRPQDRFPLPPRCVLMVSPSLWSPIPRSRMTVSTAGYGCGFPGFRTIRRTGCAVCSTGGHGEEGCCRSRRTMKC
ncbi:VgrG-related protein [Streptomyces formicae]|uniref:VgrG-related protein n=1 Tax=Streptomyces formicae TaxID=1616117 RepID=A0ABY3WRM0_9ACTN|nr:VgrG-related protein [Streptomyces formicae]UNM13205.1 VgrG-related protein [Streptomyces formicae]